jgi:hypothetical protein
MLTQNYVFTRMTLAKVVRDDPFRFFATLRSEAGARLLLETWQGAAAQCEPTCRCDSSGLGHTLTSLGPYHVAIVRLPTPRQITDAFAVGVFARDGVSGAPPEVRYLTLEYAFSPMRNAPYAMLCEWRDGRHVNHGEANGQDDAAFLRAASVPLGLAQSAVVVPALQPPQAPPPPAPPPQPYLAPVAQALPPLRVHLAGGFVAYLVIMGLLSCGFSALILWFFVVARWPKLLDAEGATLWSGRRVLWKNFTRHRHAIVRRYGATMGGRIELYFGSEKMIVVPTSLANAREALAFVARATGRDL